MAVKGQPHVKNNSGQTEWYTPAVYIEAARAAMGGIDLDPASCATANRIVRADKFYTREDKGEAQAWHGRVWLNPPYGRGMIEPFVTAVLEKFWRAEIDQAIWLSNNATETNWCIDILAHCQAVCFPKGRIRFLDATGKPAKSPLQGQLFAYFGNRQDAFKREFERFGVVLPGGTSYE